MARSASQPSQSHPAENAERSGRPTGILYVVAGPIGNLEDITLRALRILREVTLVLAEDTRITRRLLSRYDIHTPLVPCHAHTSRPKIGALIERLVAGEDLALVTDAGTPGVSDPGDLVVSAAIAAGQRIVPVPGPSAVTAAISIAAIPGGGFVFVGFPPRGRSDRQAFFRALGQEKRPIVVYESPRRIRETLQELYTHLGNRDVLVARELTKIHEEVFRGKIGDALQWSGESPRGEFTVIVYPGETVHHETESQVRDADALLESRLAAGDSPAEAAKYVATVTGLRRSQLYRRLLQLRQLSGDA